MPIFVPQIQIYHTPGARDTAWLHGARGLAALVVAFTHYVEGRFNTGFRGYLADPPDANRRFFQLPPFRIIFAGEGMVILFFIISAYSISINPLRARRNASRTKFVHSLSSSTFRRGMRLYVPTFVMECISRLALIMGLYHWSGHGKLQALSIWGHLKAFVAYMGDSIYSLRDRNEDPVNGQLWTIPLEFLGSNMVFLTILATSNLRPAMRVSTAAALAVIGFWKIDWILFTFMSGLTISEFHMFLDFPYETLPIENEMETERVTGKGHEAYRLAFEITNNLLLLVGFCMLCLPEHPREDPFSREYRFLLSLRDSHSHPIESIATIWRSLGGFLCIFAISNSPDLQAPFRTKSAQYLGKISFGVYLSHIMIYQMWRNPLLEIFSQFKMLHSALSLYIVHAVVFLLLISIVMWTGDKLTKVVDRAAVGFAKWVEVKLS